MRIQLRRRKLCEGDSDSFETPKVGETGSSHFHICFVLSLALLLRILLPTFAYVYTHDTTIFQSSDTGTYVVPAQELITQHRFFANGSPEIVRTPGYPVLLIPSLLVGHLLLVTIFLQVLFSCFTVYIVYRTALLLFDSESTALVAAGLYAIEPLSVLYTGIVLTETVFAALVMLWLYFLLRYMKRSSPGDLVISGVLLASSVYVRPVGYFLPLIITLALSGWVLLGTQPFKLRMLVHAAAFLVVSLGLMVPWQMRNERETGYSGFSAVAPYDMYFFKAASVLAAREGVPYYQVQRQLGYEDDRTYFALHPEQKTWSFAQRLKYMNGEARRILFGSPLTYARIHLEGVARTMLDPGAVDYLKFFNLYPKRGGLLGKVVDVGFLHVIGLLFVQHPLVFWSNALLAPLLLFLLASASLVLFSKKLMTQPQIVAIIAIAAYFIVIAGGPGAVCRYRHPAMPLICVLAGYGLCRVLESAS
jgi:4-amino-4-deoxy-L-arabinose transferase-like glycosyltransferase